MSQPFKLDTSRLLVLSFGGVVLLGALALWSPSARVPNADPITFIDALFTSTSAVCVTGLSVRDTGGDFSFLGQLIILLLVQAGGIGILTFSTLFLTVGGKRLGLMGRGILEETHGGLPYVPPLHLLKRIFLYTFAIEGVGAAILTFRFAFDYPPGRALWMGVFHAVSAFCNAGFGLLRNNLVMYQDDLIVNFTIMALIVCGGIGFVVLTDMSHWIRNRHFERIRMSLHTRVVGITTFWLLIGGALFCVLFESQNPSSHTNPFTLFLRMMFLSVTSRTAGFNTVDMTQLTNATILIVLILMFIGGSPGSTAGGIKTTTFATLIALTRSRMKARPAVELLDRTLPIEVVGKALATAAGYLVTVFIAVILLELTEVGHVPMANVRGSFLEHVFEVVSALGTVGLTLGITPNMTDSGKLVITGCMFLGRLGPLIVGSSLIGRQKSVPYKQPQEGMIIG